MELGLGCLWMIIARIVLGLVKSMNEKYENIITDFVFDRKNNLIKMGGIFRRIK